MLSELEVQVWTRISTSEDFHDVIEDYNTVKDLIINSRDKWVEFNSSGGYKICLYVDTITAFYESGIEIIKNAWARAEILDEIKKSESKPEWEHD